MNGNPKVSVIVPIYKAESYLYKCIDSLLTQTLADIEILLIDDGSPDGSGMICDEYARKDSRVKVFHKSNGGVASARQCGLDHACGEYVIHADPDDWVESDIWFEYALPWSSIGTVYLAGNLCRTGCWYTASRMTFWF